MNKEYSKYTSKELMEDDYFIQSMLYPTPESDEFWNSLLADGVLEYDDFDEACSFMAMMRKPKKSMTAKERNDLWVKIEVKNKKNLRKSLRRKQIYLMGIAVSFLIFLGVSAFWMLKTTEATNIDFKEVIANLPDVDQDAKDIQLVLPGNQTIAMEEKSVDIELNKEGDVLVNSKQMAEKNMQPEKAEEQVAFNQLIVPMGRHSRLTLPDGTKMHVNAGTKVVFPSRFTSKEREIFVNGEVYLEVAKAEKSPFIVHTGSMDVRVLGTVFNIKAYEQDENHSVVLVSGSVAVKTNDKHEAQLSPDQMLNYSEGKCEISAVDAEQYVSWIDGYFIYKKEPLKNIMLQISRYYGVDIQHAKDNVSSITCSGKLDLKEDLDKVMRDLMDILPIDMTKENDSYIIH